MKIKTKGLVLREMNIRDNDKLLTVLTLESGLIKVFANGVRKIGAKNASAASAFCYSEMILSKSPKGTYNLSETSVIEMFFDLRRDIVALSVAQYLGEMGAFLANEGEPSGEMLSFILNCLFCLSGDKIPPLLVKSAAELRLLTICGYMPELYFCRDCSKESDELFFDPVGGSVVCAECVSKNGGEQTGLIKLDKTTLAAMRYIVASDPKRVFSFSIPQKNIDYLSFIGEKYVTAQTEHKFKMPDFIRTLI